MADFAHYLKDTPPAQGFDEVLYPGEIEIRTEKDRLANGIAVDDETWGKLSAFAEKFGRDDLMGDAGVGHE